MASTTKSENVRVAVRVRPFNQREQDRDAKCVITMKGNKTTITDPATGKENTFAFDHSYWSHEPDGDNHVVQEQLFKDLGVSSMDSAWEGYNVSIFAYGQTGSGKSYSMVGWGDRPEDKGIIPRMYEDLFNRIKNIDDPNNKVHVEASLIEIYNEKVKDLLNPRNRKQLKVREHPKHGPYVDGCSSLTVRSHEELSSLMEEGTKARTIGATNMNATSSRAHTVFTVVLKQTMIEAESAKANDRISKINLVDLAGSERQAATAATGDRLKEGCFINKSLSTLGNCISALADNATKKKKTFVPYRDSVLTWLLKESLGGNARTVMVAALSPADVNYSETLSTLRYADRAKSIQNTATVNEDPNLLLIKTLKEEIMRLKEGSQSEEYLKLREQLLESQKIIEMMKGGSQKDDQDAEVNRQRRLMLNGTKGDVKTTCHISNLNEDPQFNNSLVYFLKGGKTALGKGGKDVSVDIQLSGLGVQSVHCHFSMNQNGVVTVSPSSEKAKLYRNGDLVTKAVKLDNHDRLLIGNHHFFLFVDPKRKTNGKKEYTPTYEKAQEEYQEKQGLSVRVQENKEMELKLNAIQKEKEEELNRQRAEFEEQRKKMEAMGNKEREEFEKKSAQLEEELKRQQMLSTELSMRKERAAIERQVLEEKLMRIIPLVQEANEMAEEMGRNTKFEVNVQARITDVAMAYEELPDELRFTRETDVNVIVRYGWLDGAKQVWSYEKFSSSRIYLMREVYQAWVEAQDSGESTEMFGDDDPFVDEIGAELVGSAMCYLQPLMHGIEVDLSIPILSYKGEGCGELSLGIFPCSRDGDEMDVEYFDDPSELVGHRTDYNFKIRHIRGLPRNACTDTYIQYKFFGDEEYRKSSTSVGTTINPNIDHEERVTMPTVTDAFLEYLEKDAVIFEVWSRQITAAEYAQKKTRAIKNAKSVIDAMQKMMKQKSEKEKPVIDMSRPDSSVNDRRRPSQTDDGGTPPADAPTTEKWKDMGEATGDQRVQAILELQNEVEQLRQQYQSEKDEHSSSKQELEELRKKLADAEAKAAMVKSKACTIL